MGSGKPTTFVTIGPTPLADGHTLLEQAAHRIAESFCVDAGPYADQEVPLDYIRYVAARLVEEFEYGTMGVALAPVDQSRKWRRWLTQHSREELAA